MYAYVWKYYVKRDQQMDFERAYGAGGRWVRFFSGSQGYFKTELLHDLSDPLQYLTIDYWDSKEEFNHFKSSHTQEFSDIDQQCALLTDREEMLGEFRLEPH